MDSVAADLACRLARDAEAVCRHYLPAGRREGRYWLVGDAHNALGRSLYVRLRGRDSGRGAAGKWTDAATGEHGDLLDLIAANQRLTTLRDTIDEARRFLALPRSQRPERLEPMVQGSPEAASRLFAMSKPVAGTLAEAYLRRRGITAHDGASALRFHPRCFYRAGSDDADGVRDAWPALIAAVTDLDGGITGLQRIYLDPGPDPCGGGGQQGSTGAGGGKLAGGKAPVATPRRAMGHLLGNAVRFGPACHVMAAGEGIETVLSLRAALPSLPLAAALSAGHLAALLFPPGLRRLYVVQDRDPAGQWAADRLAGRARQAGIEALVLAPTLGGGSQGSSGLGRWNAAGGDFNDDLRQLGPAALASALRVQLVPEDVERFWRPPERGRRSR